MGTIKVKIPVIWKYVKCSADNRLYGLLKVRQVLANLANPFDGFKSASTYVDWHPKSTLCQRTHQKTFAESRSISRHAFVQRFHTIASSQWQVSRRIKWMRRRRRCQSTSIHCKIRAIRFDAKQYCDGCSTKGCLQNQTKPELQLNAFAVASENFRNRIWAAKRKALRAYLWKRELLIERLENRQHLFISAIFHEMRTIEQNDHGRDLLRRISHKRWTSFRTNGTIDCSMHSARHPDLSTAHATLGRLLWDFHRHPTDTWYSVQVALFHHWLMSPRTNQTGRFRQNVRAAWCKVDFTSDSQNGFHFRCSLMQNSLTTDVGQKNLYTIVRFSQKRLYKTQSLIKVIDQRHLNYAATYTLNNLGSQSFKTVAPTLGMIAVVSFSCWIGPTLSIIWCSVRLFTWSSSSTNRHMLNLGDRRKKMKLADYLLNGANTTQDFTKPNTMFHCFANIIACVNSFALGTFIRNVWPLPNVTELHDAF